MNLARLCVVALVGCCLAASPAAGLSVVERDFSELVALSEEIVVGTVSRIDGGENARGGPLTLVSFTDLTRLKGNPAEPFVLQLSGGRARDGMLVQVPDMPTFAVGERAVLFVRGNGRDYCPLVGVWQGRFRVRQDPERGVAVVLNHDGSVLTGLVGSELETARGDGGGASARALTLDEFQSLIRDELQHPSK